MSESRQVLGLIPAKGGSTRLTRKNVVSLAGSSLLERAAIAAQESKIFDRLILSTEDEAIAEEGRRLGLNVPFMRPMELARDPAGVNEVALHALEELERQGQRYQTLVILLPTCPLRTGEDVRQAYDMFKAKKASFLLSVNRFSHPPFSAWKMTDGRVESFFPEMADKRSQDLPPAYRANGAVHILDVAEFQRVRNYLAQPLYAYEMPIERSVDIDTIDDLRVAEAFLKT